MGSILEKIDIEKEIQKNTCKDGGVETQFRKVKQLYKLENLQIRNWKRRKNQKLTIHTLLLSSCVLRFQKNFSFIYALETRQLT